MAYLRKRNFTLAGVDLGNETLDTGTGAGNGNVMTTVDPNSAAGEVLPVEAGGFGGSVNLFGIEVPLMNMGLGALAGYFLGNKADALRNAALGAAAGVGISYFMNR